MKGYVKWLGGSLGWALGGPIGGLLGVIVGSLIDATSSEKDSAFINSGSQRASYTRPGDFKVSLLVLTAAIMRADGITKKSELDYVKRFLVNQYGSAEAQNQLKLLKDLLDRQFNLREIGHQIRYQMRYPDRLQLLHYLFGIAQADGEIHASELAMIGRIAAYLGINTADFESIRAMFMGNRSRQPSQPSANDYQILEITQDASDDEVKKAYRKMAKKYHPDKVTHLGEAVKEQAEEKFLKVQEAYERIKKQRGIK